MEKRDSKQVYQMVLSCTSDALSLAPDLYFSLECPRPGVVPFDSMGRLGVDPFGVKPLVGLAGATPSSIILSCCCSSLTENVSEWKDNRSLLDPGTRSLSRGITSPELANWKKVLNAKLLFRELAIFWVKNLSYSN